MQTEKYDLAKGIVEAVSLDSYRLSRMITDNIQLTGSGEINPTPPALKGGKGEEDFQKPEVIINDFNSCPPIW